MPTPLNRQPVSPLKATERLEALCMRAERCTGELREKLRGWGVDSNDADKILQHLIDTRFVDDRRFAEAFVRDKVRIAHWGRIKVRHAMYIKRIEKSIIADAMSSIDDDEYYNILLNLLHTKVKVHPHLLGDIKGRTKLYRFAISRGFESELITRAVKALLNRCSND